MRSRFIEPISAVAAQIAAAILANGSSGKELASATSTTYQSGLGAGPTDMTGLTTGTFTVTSGKPVWVEVILSVVYATTSSATATVTICADTGDSVDAANVIKRSTFVTLATATGQPIIVRERISTPGVYNRKVRLTRPAGTGTLSNNAAGDATYVSSIRVIEG